MNVELKPIAESKIRQLGGDVCGVLVRKDGRLAAVDEHGRVQWLQDDSGDEYTAYLEAMNSHLKAELEAARAQGGQGAEPVAVVELSDYIHLSGASASQRKALKEVSEGSIQNLPVGTRIYTHPQPAQQGSVPEGWRVIRMPELQKALMTGPIIGLDGPRGESVPVVSDSDDRRERHLYQFLDALLSTPTTPQADERVHAKCGGRVIGRMRDGDSVSCEKCGRAGHVLIDDGGIDIDWAPAGQGGLWR